VAPDIVEERVKRAYPEKGISREKVGNAADPKLNGEGGEEPELD